MCNRPTAKCLTASNGCTIVFKCFIPVDKDGKKCVVIFPHISFVFLYHSLPTPSGVDLVWLSFQLPSSEAEYCFPRTTQGQNRAQTLKTSYIYAYAISHIFEYIPILPLIELRFLSSSEELHFSAFHFQLDRVVIICE